VSVWRTDRSFGVNVGGESECNLGEGLLGFDAVAEVMGEVFCDIGGGGY